MILGESYNFTQTLIMKLKLCHQNQVSIFLQFCLFHLY